VLRSELVLSFDLAPIGRQSKDRSEAPVPRTHRRRAHSCTVGAMAGLNDLAVQDDPFDYYRQRLGECPVWHEPDIDLYVIGGHAEARRALMDVETFSSTRHAPTVPDEAAVAYQRRLAERGWPRAATLQRTDPPVHTRYRKLLNRVFSPAKVAELTPRIEEIAVELIDGVADRGSCEFVADFALPLPGILIAEQLGLDRADYQQFRRWADAMLSLAQRRMTVDEALAEADVELEAQHFLAAEFERRRDHPTDDLISRLVHAHGDDEQPFTMAELQDLMHQLVTGGFETTTGALAAGMWVLVTHPELQARLRAEPELMTNFVEEALRFDSPVQGLWRKSTRDADVAGVTIPAGSSVMIRFGAANRDADVFDEPDRFDVDRPEARNHVAFGFGAHFCIGAALARQELHSGFTLLLSRLDDFALAEPLPAPAHEPSFFLRPMKRLPITFSAR
jgi:cytochrome P450